MRYLTAVADLPTYDACLEVARLARKANEEAHVAIQEGRRTSGPWRIRIFMEMTSTSSEIGKEIQTVVTQRGGSVSLRNG